MQKRGAFILLLVGVFLCVLSAPSLAASDNALDQIVDLYKNNARNWEESLTRFALSLFWLLAGIEFSFAALRMAFRGADLGEWLSEVVTQVLFIGFFYALLTHASEWARIIVESFQRAAQTAGHTGGIAPSDVFDVGMQVAGKFVEATSMWSPTASLGLLLAALIVIVCFAIITAYLILALVESYIVISAGVLFMGFGGSRWTKDFATKILIYAVSVGAKLFILQLLVTLGAQTFNALAANVETNNASLFVIVGSSIVMLALTKIVPEMVQGLINGTSFGGGGALTGTAVAAAAVAASAVVATRGAQRLASEQLAGRETPPAGGAMGRGVWMAGTMARNLGGAVLDNIGQRLGGRAAHGTRLGQVGLAMHERATMMRNERERQEPNNQGQQNNGGGQ